MKWLEAQSFLSTGRVAARTDWPEDTYVEFDEGSLCVFSESDPEGTPYTPDDDDKAADDWFVVGVA
jgi:hypothetical protein